MLVLDEQELPGAEGQRAEEGGQFGVVEEVHQHPHAHRHIGRAAHQPVDLVQGQVLGAEPVERHVAESGAGRAGRLQHARCHVERRDPPGRRREGGGEPADAAADLDDRADTVGQFLSRALQQPGERAPGLVGDRLAELGRLLRAHHPREPVTPRTRAPFLGDLFRGGGRGVRHVEINDVRPEKEPDIVPRQRP